MRLLPLWLSLGAVVLSVGLGLLWHNRLRFLPLHTTRLPGLDVDLPDGTPDPPDGLSNKTRFDYGKGQMTIMGMRFASLSFQIGWEAGELFDDEVAQYALNVVGGVFDKKVTSVPIATPVAVFERGPTRSWAGRAGAVELWATQIVCGARRVTAYTVSGNAGLEHLHRRIARSIRCRPDAAKERTVGDVPVVFDLESGWFRLPSSEDLKITNGREVLAARPFSIAHDQFVKGEHLLQTPGLSGIVFGTRDGDAWPIEMTVETTVLHGWVVVRTCPGGQRSLLLKSLNAGGGPDDAGRALLARARCRNANERRQTWPPLPADPQ